MPGVVPFMHVTWAGWQGQANFWCSGQLVYQIQWISVFSGRLCFKIQGVYWSRKTSNVKLWSQHTLLTWTLMSTHLYKHIHSYVCLYIDIHTVIHTETYISHMYTHKIFLIAAFGAFSLQICKRRVLVYLSHEVCGSFQ